MSSLPSSSKKLKSKKLVGLLIKLCISVQKRDVMLTTTYTAGTWTRAFRQNRNMSMRDRESQAKELVGECMYY